MNEIKIEGVEYNDLTETLLQLQSRFERTLASLNQISIRLEQMTERLERIEQDRR